MARLKKRGKIRFNFGGIILGAIAIAAVVGFIWVQNGYTYINKITYENNLIPRQFTGYKIAHLSNIDNERLDLVSKLKDTKVDMIIVSGGIVDADGGFSNSIKVLDELTSIAPTYYVLQKQDMQYKNDIIASTKASYINGNSVTIESKDVNVMDYINYNCDAGMIKEIEKNTEESQAYIKYIEQALVNDKNKTIEILGMDCHSENIYDDFDMLYSVLDNTSSLSISALGNISKYKDIEEFGDLGVEVYLAGGTYGLKNHIAEFDGTDQDISYGSSKIFSTAGICKEVPNTRRFFNFREIQIIELDDGLIYKRNPLERFFGIFVEDVGTVFDRDDGFKEHTYDYE